jgi:hypothetical protein
MRLFANFPSSVFDDLRHCAIKTQSGLPAFMAYLPTRIARVHFPAKILQPRQPAVLTSAPSSLGNRVISYKIPRKVRAP